MEDKALMYVAKAADGSLRDGLSLLDQCVAFHYGKILTYENALEVLGAVDAAVFSQMFNAVSDGRTKDCISSLEDIVIQGRELGQFVTDFIWYMRNLLLVQSSDDVEGLVDMSEENIKQLKEDASRSDGPTLMRYIRVFSELSNQLRYASQKRVLVEVALIKLTRPAMEPNLDSILQRLGDLEAQVEELEAGAIAVPASGSAPYVQASGMPPAEPEIPPEKVALPQAQIEDLKLVRNEWARIVRSMGGGAKSYLRDTVVEPGGENCLTIVFMDSMSYDMGRRPTVIGELERYVEANYGKSIYFKTRLAGHGERLNTIYVTEEDLKEKIHMDITEED